MQPKYLVHKYIWYLLKPILHTNNENGKYLKDHPLHKTNYCAVVIFHLSILYVEFCTPWGHWNKSWSPTFCLGIVRKDLMTRKLDLASTPCNLLPSSGLSPGISEQGEVEIFLPEPPPIQGSSLEEWGIRAIDKCVVLYKMKISESMYYVSEKFLYISMWHDSPSWPPESDQYGTWTLRLADCSLPDAGEVTATATNVLATTTCRCQVKVLPEGTPLPRQDASRLSRPQSNQQVCDTLVIFKQNKLNNF